jgi:hypothetical protein
MRTYGLILCVSLSCGSDKSASGGEETTGTSGEASSSSGDATPTDVTATVTDTEASTNSPSTGEPGTTEALTGTEGETFASSGEPSSSGETTGAETSTGAPPVGDATVEDSCAPDDGPALEFKLELSAPTCGASWATETLRVVLFQAGPLAPGVYALDGGFGFATRQGMDEQEMVVGTSGSVTIETWDAAAVVGSYELVFEDASERAGGFAGPVCPAMPLCG